MNIAAKTVVTLTYTLKDDTGEVLDSSEGGEPLAYVHGLGTLVPGLEKALEGRSEGESLEVTLSPEEGYGQRDEKLVRNMPLRKLGEKRPKVGMRVVAQTDEGRRMVLIKALSGDYATVDANHPLAGMTLHFAVKVVGVRAATADELAHGHVHGEGGHHHH